MMEMRRWRRYDISWDWCKSPYYIICE